MKLTREQEQVRSIASKVMLYLESQKALTYKHVRFLASIGYVESYNGRKNKANVQRFYPVTDKVLSMMLSKGYIVQKGKMIFPTEAGLYSLKKWRAVTVILNYNYQSHFIYVVKFLEWFGYQPSHPEDGIPETIMLDSIALYTKDNQKQGLEEALELLERMEVVVKRDGCYFATDIIDEIVKYM